MKKSVFTQYVVLSLMALYLTACSESEEFAQNGHRVYDPDVINMNVLLDNERSSITRAAETTLSTLETEGNSFMVWGYFSPTAQDATPGALYVGDSDTSGTLINYSDGAWDYADPSKKALWPSRSAPLNFQAVTPANYGTIVNSPADNVPMVAVSVTVPADNALQKDLLFGHEENVTQDSHSSSVQLTFEHAMAQVAFQARKTLASLSVEIGGITVHNVRNSASVGYLGGLSGDRRILDVSDYASSVSSFSVGMKASEIAITTSTPVALSADGGMLMMLPQSGTKSPDAWNTSSASPVSIETANATGSEQSYIEVVCKVHSGDMYVVGTPAAYGSIYIPFKADWAVGCKYTYTLSFGSGAGGFDANGKPLLSIISYDVDSMASWAEVETSTLPKGTDPVNNAAEIL